MWYLLATYLWLTGMKVEMVGVFPTMYDCDNHGHLLPLTVYDEALGDGKLIGYACSSIKPRDF